MLSDVRISFTFFKWQYYIRKIGFSREFYLKINLNFMKIYDFCISILRNDLLLNRYQIFALNEFLKSFNTLVTLKSEICKKPFNREILPLWSLRFTFYFYTYIHRWKTSSLQSYTTFAHSLSFKPNIMATTSSSVLAACQSFKRNDPIYFKSFKQKKRVFPTDAHLTFNNFC